MLHATHYKHSGKAPIGGILLSLVAGFVAAALLGVAYAYLIFYIPFVYINFFITIGFGALLGVAVGAAAKAGKVRNNAVVAVIALIAAAVGYYIHWAFWIAAATEVRSFDPNALWAFIQVLNTLGPWSIFGWTPTGGPLWFIWGVELLMIVLLGMLAAHAMTSDPFCEATGQWTTRTNLPRRFTPLPDDATIESGSAVPGMLSPVPDDSPAYTEVSLFSAEGSELRCVTLQGVTVEIDKDGKEDASKRVIAHQLLLDRDSFDKLQRMGETAAASPAEAAADGGGIIQSS